MTHRLTWVDSYNVGHPTIDAQHQRLFQMIERYAEISHSSVRSEAVSEALDEIRQYADSHLEFEENLLRERGYEDLEGHRAKHISYRRRFTELCMATLEGDPGVPGGILEFLIGWWTKHVQAEDRIWASALGFLGGTGPAGAPAQ